MEFLDHPMLPMELRPMYLDLLLLLQRCTGQRPTQSRRHTLWILMMSLKVSL